MQKIRIAAIGVGNRMNAYTEYALLHPEEMEVVAVVEPNELRRKEYQQRFSILENRCFSDFSDFFAQPKLADAIFLCTPDDLHYNPSLQALEKGYDILLEKPIAQSWQECVEIAEKADKLNRIVGICHVLRYHPYFIKIKELTQSGELGEIMSINHVEAVGVERMTHGFVRGLWRKREESNPMILSKACHDLDLLTWITERKCINVSSYGSLKWFKKENAPVGSTARCTDGCQVEAECPFSALNLYYRKKKWLRHFDIPEGVDIDETILNELKHGLYGRCVYRCDNNVVDHQVVSMLMEDAITINFTIDGFTKEGGRFTHIKFSMGEIYGNEKYLTVRWLHPDKKDEIYDFSDFAGECNFHGGADLNIVKDFIQAVRKGEASSLTTNIKSSLESHRIAFEIEKNRKDTNP